LFNRFLLAVSLEQHQRFHCAASPIGFMGPKRSDSHDAPQPSLQAGFIKSKYSTASNSCASELIGRGQRVEKASAYSSRERTV
jgi:hypothetical protein